jgi:hypothetical protein
MAITPNTEGKTMGIPAITYTPGPKGYRGYRAHRIAKTTGAVIVLLDGNDADMDTDAGRWSLLCDTHGSVCAFTHQTIARQFMAHPGEWCDDCAHAHHDEAGAAVLADLLDGAA